MNVLKNWLKVASPEARVELAELAGTTAGGLHQAAGCYKTGGKLALSPEFAARIEKAAVAIREPGLPKLKREDLSPVCGGCDYAKRCRKI